MIARTRPFRFLQNLLYGCLYCCILQVSAIEPVRVESSVDLDTVIAGQQLLFTVSIFHETPLVSPSLPSPVLKDAIIYQAGKVRTGRDGSENFIRITWAIFPLKPGKITLPSLPFSATLEKTEKQPYEFSSAAQININTKSHDISVLPAMGTAFPSKNVQLREKESTYPESEMMKQPIQRTMILEAEGVPARLLPLPVFNSNAEQRVELSHIISENISHHKGITGRKIITLSITPLKSGTITLPDLFISWWNTEKKSMETSTVSSRTLKIQPASHSYDGVTTFSAHTYHEISATRLIMMFSFFTLFFSVLFVLYRAKRQTLSAILHKRSIKKRERQSWKQVISACNRQCLKKTRYALVKWSENHEETVSGNPWFQKKFRELTYQMDQCLFSGKKRDPNFNIFLKQVRILRKQLLLFQKKHGQTSIPNQAFLPKSTLRLKAAKKTIVFRNL